MPWKTVATAGTQVQLTATRTYCCRITLQWRDDNTSTSKIYLGLPGTHNTGADVSSTDYDCILTASQPSVTLGLGNPPGTQIDISEIWIDSSANDEGVNYFIE